MFRCSRTHSQCEGRINAIVSAELIQCLPNYFRAKSFSESNAIFHLHTVQTFAASAIIRKRLTCWPSKDSSAAAAVSLTLQRRNEFFNSTPSARVLANGDLFSYFFVVSPVRFPSPRVVMHCTYALQKFRSPAPSALLGSGRREVMASKRFRVSSFAECGCRPCGG